ncbi:MAG: helix-turn-helix transcriptional regulator [Acidimicrobiales bacterium]
MDQGDQRLADELEAIAALAEPTRRSLYEHVVHRGDWVSREQAADAVGIQRTLAAHHLDRLVDGGLLEVDYRRAGGRSGPGAGRPAKLYRRSPRQFEVTLPARQYELAARILAEAADEARRGGIPIDEVVDRTAGRAGETLAASVRGRLGGRASRTRSRQAVLAQLESCGFEPQADGALIRLRNCPFRDLARRHPDLVCGINRELLGRLVEGVPETGFDARLEPEDGMCCVRLHTK